MKKKATRPKVVKATKKRILKMTDLISGVYGLHGLEEEGSVWVYLGESRGWKPLPMTAATGYEMEDGEVRGL